MRALTKVEDYRNPAVFAREQQAIFRNHWQFACLARDLTAPDDYIVTRIGGKPVIVQNFSGELKGFLNVCSHRFSAIRRAEKGNGLLQCQYHGWVYDCAGLPTGISNIKGFEGMTEARRKDLALEGWEVQRCGELIFVRPERAEGPDLKSWLGDAWHNLETAASSLGSQVDCNRMVIESNWKVAVENTLESYHVRSVHPDTFARLGAAAGEFRFSDPHSSWKTSIDPSLQGRLNQLNRRMGIVSPFDGYFHLFVFPSLTLATTAGMTYALQSFRPLSTRRTEFTSYVFAARQENGSEAQRKLLIEACGAATEFNRSVFEEDRLICEQAQHGIDHAPDWGGELSREEGRVYDFQRAWGEWMPGLKKRNPRSAAGQA